jgi:EAL domain-containing protein (putative c-di-GMP-specific phosphodiesterase class I)
MRTCRSATARASTSSGCRRLGDGAALPLHVPVSQALLGDAAALASALDLFSLYPALAGSVLVSLPAAAIAAADAEVVARIADRGLLIAQEGWNSSPSAAQQAKRRGVVVAKISSDRLLDRDRNADERGSALSILEEARTAGIFVVATDVRSDEDAVNLIDLGVEIMSGTRFSGPKRLKAEAVRDRLATP